MIRWETMGPIVKVIGLRALPSGAIYSYKKTLSDLGAQARGRRIIQTTETGDVFQIREESESYKPLFGSKKYDIAPKNTHDWM